MVLKRITTLSDTRSHQLTARSISAVNADNYLRVGPRHVGLVPFIQIRVTQVTLAGYATGGDGLSCHLPGSI